MNNSSCLTPNTTVLPMEETAITLWRVVPPVLLTAGTVGSTLSVVIFSQKDMRKFRMSYYLIFLAVADLLVLYSGLLRQWIVYMFDTDIRDIHPALCKINTWLVYFSLDMSAWILVSVTVERAFAVWNPLKIMLLTKRMVYINITCLAVILLIVNGHFAIGLGTPEASPEQNPCDEFFCESLFDEYAHFKDYVFPWIDMCLFCIGPFLFQIVGNAFIISGLCVNFRNIMKLDMLRDDQARRRTDQITSMTRMLLSRNAVYLICTLPISAYLIYLPHWEQDMSPEADAQRRLTYACVNLVMYLNNSTNFISYSVGGRKFRSTFSSVLCRWRTKNGKP